MNTDITNYSSLWRLQEKHHPGTIPSMHQPKLFSVEGITVRRQEKADKLSIGNSKINPFIDQNTTKQSTCTVREGFH